MKVSSDFGGDTKELEELKIQETLLTEEMMNNPTTEVLEKWRNVKKKIADFNSTGVGLTDAELKQFDMDVLSTMSDDQKRKYIEDVLEKALPFINTLFHRLEEVVQELLKSISDQQVAFEEDRQSQELQKQELSKEIADFQQEIGLKYKIRDAVLHKYKATPDNLLEKIAQVYEQAKRQYRTSIERDDWEEIFRGLENWVQDIPDYQQEKDIYLKDFINGCNVVGVSCTENAKTLTENGFDDFDVVIIDEVSKATPPELLIPMLRGRKIVLVGDHRQLPPLFNEHEKTYLEVAEQQEDMEDVIVPLTMEDFNKYKDMVTASLFERYFENANDSIKETLNYQYRMHTDIMDIINIFYDEYLRDGNEDNYTYDTKAHYLSIPSTSGTEMIIPERHAYWFDSSELAGEKIYEQRRQGSSSAENLVEAEMIMAMLKKMELQYANMKGRETPVSIGVISFYYDQVALIRQMLRQESFYAIDVEVNTVDRFQGKEKEIVFVSLVRNVKNFRHSVDSHIAAFQRINVAFSRAQNLLIIVGAISAIELHVSGLHLFEQSSENELKSSVLSCPDIAALQSYVSELRSKNEYLLKKQKINIDEVLKKTMPLKATALVENIRLIEKYAEQAINEMYEQTTTIVSDAQSKKNNGKKIYIVDTCALMHHPDLFLYFEDEEYVRIPTKVIDELGKIKDKRNKKYGAELSETARILTREIERTYLKVYNKNNKVRLMIENAAPELLPRELDSDVPDNQILSVALKYKNWEVFIISDDGVFRLAAMAQRIVAMNSEDFINQHKEHYKSLEERIKECNSETNTEITSKDIASDTESEEASERLADKIAKAVGNIILEPSMQSEEEDGSQELAIDDLPIRELKKYIPDFNEPVFSYLQSNQVKTVGAFRHLTESKVRNMPAKGKQMVYKNTVMRAVKQLDSIIAKIKLK